jgi:hypothetical protein
MGRVRGAVLREKREDEAKAQLKIRVKQVKNPYL